MAAPKSAANDVTLEEVLSLAQKLRPVDQARLVVRLASSVEALIEQVDEQKALPPRQPLRGLFSDLGVAPSSEDIDEVQREMWARIGQE